MARPKGDAGYGPGGLPRPPVLVGFGLETVGFAWAWWRYLFSDTLPYLASRLAQDTDGHKAGDNLPR